MALTAQVQNASGTIIGNMVHKITGLQHSLRMDETGTFSLTLPYADPVNAQLFQKGFYVVAQLDFETIAVGIIDQITRSNDTLTVSGRDTLAELSFIETGIDYRINAEPSGEVFEDIIGLVSGWTVISPTAGDVSVVANFKGRKADDTIHEIARMLGFHMRRVGTRQLEIGVFGADSGFKLVNPEGWTHEMQSYEKLLPITRIQEVTTSSQIVNRLIAYGGQYSVNGVARTLTMVGDSSLSSYSVQSRPRNGATEQYIEDSSSIALYGVREEVQTFSDIRPPDDPDAAILNSAQYALLSRAVNHLMRFSAPQVAYSVDTPRKVNAQAGDTIRLIYNDAYTAIDDDFYITEIQTGYAGTTISTSLQLSSVDRIVLNDADMLFSALQKLQEQRFKDL